MTDIFAKIHDDINEYVYLCEKYGHKIRYRKNLDGTQDPDCYGKHARKLQDMAHEEYRKTFLGNKEIR